MTKRDGERPAKRDEKAPPTLQEDLERELGKLGLDSPGRIIEEFELLTISDDATFLAREIAKKVKDRLAHFVQLLEELLAPNADLSAMNECNFFSESERAGIGKAFRELMSVLRGFTMADVEGNEDAYRAFLKECLPRWAAQKPFLATVTKRLHEDWSKAEPLQGEHGYFG